MTNLDNIFFCLRYDKKDTSKMSLVDLQFLAAMGPPGGGRNPITPRFLRHFNVIVINEFNDETMTRIFSSIVAFYLKVNNSCQCESAWSLPQGQ